VTAFATNSFEFERSEQPGQAAALPFASQWAVVLWAVSADSDTIRGPNILRRRLTQASTIEFELSRY